MVMTEENLTLKRQCQRLDTLTKTSYISWRYE